MIFVWRNFDLSLSYYDFDLPFEVLHENNFRFDFWQARQKLKIVSFEIRLSDSRSGEIFYRNYTCNFIQRALVGQLNFNFSHLFAESVAFSDARIVLNFDDISITSVNNRPFEIIAA